MTTAAYNDSRTDPVLVDAASHTSLGYRVRTVAEVATTRSGCLPGGHCAGETHPAVGDTVRENSDRRVAGPIHVLHRLVSLWAGRQGHPPPRVTRLVLLRHGIAAALHNPRATDSRSEACPASSAAGNRAAPVPTALRVCEAVVTGRPRPRGCEAPGVGGDSGYWIPTRS
jgi:hypothetical protein